MLLMSLRKKLPQQSTVVLAEKRLLELVDGDEMDDDAASAAWRS